MVICVSYMSEFNVSKDISLSLYYLSIYLSIKTNDQHNTPAYFLNTNCQGIEDQCCEGLGQGHSPCIRTFTSAMQMRMQGSAPLNMAYLVFG